MTTMVLHDPRVPAAPYPVAPAYGAGPGQVAPGPPPPPAQPPWPAPPERPRRGRRRWLTGAAAVALVAVGVGGGTAVGRITAPSPAPVVKTVKVPGQPEPQRFTDADTAWCREYLATIHRLVDAGKATGARRPIAAQDLPASAWTPADWDANRRLAEYMSNWPPSLAQLQASASNTVLKLLIAGDAQDYGALADKIKTGTYVPADYALYRDINITESALSGACRDMTSS